MSRLERSWARTMMITVKVMTSFLVLGQLESLSETSRTVRGAALEY